MKKATLFFGILVCLASLFSCHKQEGEIIEPWGSDTNTDFVRCSFVSNVDYAIYNVSLHLNALAHDSLKLKNMELLCWENSQRSTDTVRLNILKDVTLVKRDEVLVYSDTLQSLSPNQTYSYKLVMTDGILMNESIDGSFVTLDPKPSVKVDTAIFENGMFTCKATVGAYRRALLDTPPYELGLFWGPSMDSINTVIDVDPDIHVNLIQTSDSLSMQFSGSIVNPGVVNLWFKAYVKDSWGNEVFSDAFKYARDPISQIIAEPNMANAENGVVILTGKASQGAEDVVLFQRGFCYGLSENPTVFDEVVLANGADWGVYSCQLNDLQPNTTYYFRSFLRITDENGPVYYSSNCSSFTMPEAALPVHVMVGNQIEHSMIPAGLYVLTASVDGDVSLVEERGYLWKTQVDGDETPVTFDNSEGSMTGYSSSEIPSEYSLALMLAGVSLGPNDYVVIISGLQNETIYTCRAYIKWNNGDVIYSDGTLEVKTAPGK